MQKTLAMKLLTGKKIPYTPMTYPTEMRDAVAIAAVFGAPPGQVFKTLVVTAPAPGIKPMLVMVPADRQLDLKKLAKAVGVKKLKMATHAEAEKMTGLQVGGISPLALLNRGFAIYLDAFSREWDEVFISAGQRGINLRLSARDLEKVTRARVVDVAD